MFEIINIPPEMSGLWFISLVTLSLVTSFISAALGIGGGTIMLAVLAQVLPVKAIIPIHGMVQLGSNVGRAAVLAAYVQWKYLIWFFCGCVIGVLIGGNIVILLPNYVPSIILSLFILYSVWGPKFVSQSKGLATLTIGGLISSVLTMFVGATGPFILALLKALDLPRTALVASNAACMVIQHLLKVIVFTALGFTFAPYLSLIVLMVISGLLGTIIGKKFLLKINQQRFQLVTNIVLTILALRMLLNALSGLKI